MFRTPYRSPPPASESREPPSSAEAHADRELLPVYGLLWLACGAHVCASVVHDATTEQGAIVAAMVTALLPMLAWPSLRSMWSTDVKDP